MRQSFSTADSGLFFLKKDRKTTKEFLTNDWMSHPLGNPKNWSVSLKNLNATLNSAQIPMLLLWSDKLYQFYNDSYFDSIGRLISNIGVPLTSESDFNLFTVIHSSLETILSSGNSLHFKDIIFPVVFEDGARDEYWTLECTPVFDDDESIAGILILFFQTTDKIANLKSLGEGQRDMEFAIDASELGIWDYNPVTGNLTVNERLKDWFGLENLENPFNLAIEIIFEKDRARVTSAIREALICTSNSGYDIEYTIVNRKTGVKKMVRAKGKAVFDEHGVAQRLNGTLEDVSEKRKSQELFQSIVDQSPFAICLLAGRDLIIEVANNTMLGHWGADKSAIGKTLAFVLPELVGQPYLQILDDVFTTGIMYTDVGAPAVLSIDDESSIYYFDFTYKALKDATGTVYGVMIMSNDVTQRILAEKHAEEIQRQILDSFQQSPVGIATIDTQNLTFRMINPFFGKIVGRNAELITNKPILEAIPELSGQGIDSRISEVIISGFPHSEKEVNIEIVRDGVLDNVYLDLTYQPRQDAKGHTIGVYLVAIDVTEQVLSRHVIEDAQIALKETVNLAKLSTWQLELDSGLFTYSERFNKWMGLKDEITSIEEFYKILSDSDREIFQSAIHSLLKPDSKGLHVAEYQLINQTTGQRRIISANAQVFYDASGTPEHISGTAQNVTRDRMLQDELKILVKQRTVELETTNEILEISNRELQQFAYIASHDLQEPIRKISVFVDMLEGSLEQISPKVETLIEKIKTSSSRMSNLIRDILSISQLTHSVPDFKKTDLNQIINEIIRDFELAIEQKDAKISCINLPVIDAIPLQMTQLFGNLISNSLKYSRKEISPEITIEGFLLSENENKEYSANGQKFYKIELRDNGIGFEQKYAEKIFEIFQRLHGKNEFLGTGIGLAICKKIVQNHHGVIKAESSGIRGAVFTIILPIERNVVLLS